MSQFTRPFLMATAATIALFAHTPSYAQWHYPAGYGPFGWGGWGFGVGTVQGDIATGLGAMAAGVGVYNQQTAVANAIDTQTAIQFNQYMHLSQLEANRRYQQRLAERQKTITEGAAATADRLRNRPTPADVTSGDALNAAYDDLGDPRIYTKALSASRATVPGTLIRAIPFQKASAAITVSMDDLTKKGAPAALRTDAFETLRSDTRSLVEELKRQNEETGEYQNATLEKVESNLAALIKKNDEVYKRNTREWNESRRFLKAAYGLARMLQTPAIDVLLAGVEKRPETTIGELLNFMHAFNLRFGAAKSPEQRQAYVTLYPLLAALRNEALSGGALPPPPPADPEQARAFFEGMEIQDISKHPQLKATEGSK